MRYRACLSLALIAAITACASVTDGPTEPARFDSHIGEDPGGSIGEPPPPRLDTGETNIDIAYDGGFRRVPGLYFANKQGTNAWIAFVSNSTVTATPNARLQYNEKTGRTHGTGLLDFGGGNTLDLSRVRITQGSFGSCPAPSNPSTGDRVGRGYCGQATFTAGDGGGLLTVSPRSRTVVTGQ
jgi:hypothetical protein